MMVSSPRPRRPLRRAERLGAVRLHERLGAPGPAASVHLGWLEREERLIAVKRLHPAHAADELAVARVHEAARRAMRVEHPNVVATLGVVRWPAEVLAAMEYVPGASLEEIAQRAPGGLEPRVASAICAGALRGLDAAHEARAPDRASRVVSPGRVIVGEDGGARVLDFDVAGAGTAAAVVDDLPYAAPEQLLGGSGGAGGAGVQRDVYAASVVLWETLTGRALFRGSTVEAVLRSILEGMVPAPSSVAVGIGPGLDAIVLRGLARDPRARFESASAMAEALEEASCASAAEVATALARLDLSCIRRRRLLAEVVHGREGNTLHFECTRSATKE
jgi:eukaryotic-like serine/threonine-protein kinase